MRLVISQLVVELVSHFVQPAFLGNGLILISDVLQCEIGVPASSLELVELLFSVKLEVGLSVSDQLDLILNGLALDHHLEELEVESMGDNLHVTPLRVWIWL